MKKNIKQSFVIFACLCFFLMASTAHAELIDRGGGLIYDTVLDITWLQDNNYAYTSGYNNADQYGRMTWDEAMGWADQLVYADYDDWRLPNTVDGPYVFGYDGTTTAGYNITSGEMGHLYYVTLGNLGMYDLDGNKRSSGYGPVNTGPFNFDWGHVYHNEWWTGTDTSSDPIRAWDFHFGSGAKHSTLDYFAFNAWAVRDGDSVAPVPEPTTFLLLGTGLSCLAGYRRKQKKR